MLRLLKPALVVAAIVTLLAALAGCVPPAQTAPAQQQGFDWTIIVFLVLIFAVFYFLMVRPQRKRQKQQQEMMRSLQKGARVITAGGVYGEIEGIDEETVLLKVESGAIIRISKNSVVGIRQR